MLKIARDISLIDENEKEFDPVAIVSDCLMTEENWKDIACFDTSTCGTFEEAVAKYCCDVCDKNCSRENSVYTNKTYQGVDICSDCVSSAFERGLSPSPSWNPGPVYHLSDLVRIIRESLMGVI